MKANSASHTLHVTFSDTIPPATVSVSARPGDSVATALWLSGTMPPVALCAGLGQCGACRVRFIETPPLASDDEVRILGKDAVESGWRLGCRHEAEDGMKVEVPAKALSSRQPAERDMPLPAASSVSDVASLLLAVDLGTTSIQWRAVTASGHVHAEGGLLNPQLGIGSDVMSRIAAARTPSGRKRLQDMIVRVLHGIMDQRDMPVSELCVAGNPAMTAILLDRDCTGLAAAPYALPESGGGYRLLPSLPPLWIPPQLAPFVGGDVSAGVAYLLDGNPQFPFLLADMGTNGEFVLVRDASSALIASVPLGPALEGIGLTHGVMAGEGSIVAFDVSPSGLRCRFFGNDVPPQGMRAAGIAGTGYLSLLSLLRKANILRPDGQPAKNDTLPLFRRLASLIRHESDGEWWMELPHGQSLTASDVESLLKVKAAFSLAVCHLLREEGLLQERLSWNLAGALGKHASREDLEQLGFLPYGLGARLHVLGNASLEGATRLLTRRELRSRLIRWSQGCRVTDLTAREQFMQDYIRSMSFLPLHC